MATLNVIYKIGADITEMVKGIDRAADSSEKLVSMAKNVGVALTSAFTLRAGFNFVKDVLDDASALKDLSQQTHIAVEDIQILAGAMSEFGVDQDTLAKGLFTLSRKIAGGDDSIADALATMGLSLKDVDGLNGQELFLKIEHGLSTLQGGLRDNTASEVFGSKLGMAMAGASEGIDGAIDTWKRLNNVASTESVDAMDQFGESIARANKNISSIAANMIGPLAEGFNVLNDGVNKGAGKFAVFWAMTKDMTAAATGLGTGTENLTKLLDEQNQKTETVAALMPKASAAVGAHAGATKAARDAAKQFAETMEQLSAVGAGWVGTLDTIDGAVVQGVRYYLDAGVAQDKLAEAYGLTAAQVKSVASSLKDEQAAFATEMKSIEETTKLWNQYNELRITHGGSATDAQIAQIHRWADDLTAQVHQAGADTMEFYTALEAVSKEKLDGVKVNWDDVSKYSQKGLQDTADRAWATFNAISSASSGASREVIDHFRQIAEAAQAQANGWSSAFESASQSAVDSTKHAGEAVVDLMHSMSMAQAALQGDLESTIKSVQTLAGEWITAAEAKKRFDMGSTLDVAHAARDPEIMALLKTGWSLENAQAIKLARQWGFTPQLFSPSGAPETSPSPSERVPGYAHGGIVKSFRSVGTDTVPAMLTPGEMVLTKDQQRSVFSRRSGGDSTQVIHVSVTQPLGTPDQVARAVGDALKTTLSPRMRFSRLT